MKIRLLLDEDVHAGLAHALRQRGFDVVHAQEQGLKGRTDQELLAQAISQGRCLFSFNVKDFVILHNQWVQTQQDHWGIIVARQSPFRATMHKLLQFLQHNTQEDMKNRLAFL
jgi:predicted nuclease of predicted toxin-antitoxin system